MFFYYLRQTRTKYSNVDHVQLINSELDHLWSYVSVIQNIIIAL